MPSATAVIKLTVEQKQALRELGKFKQDFTTMIGGTVAKLTALAGAGGIGAFLTKAVFASANAQLFATALDVVGQRAGYSREELQSYEKQLEALGLATEVRRQGLLTLINNEGDLAKAVDLARLAMDASVTSTADTEEIWYALIRAMLSGETRLLRTYNIFVDLTEAERRYAKAHGVAVEALSPVVRQEIAFNAIMEQNKNLLGTHAANVDKVAVSYRGLKDKVKDVLIKIGEPLQGPVAALINKAKEIGDKVIRWVDANKDLIEQKVGDWVKAASEKIGRATEIIARHADEVERLGKVFVYTMIAAKLAEFGMSIKGLVKALWGLKAFVGGGGPLVVLTAMLVGANWLQHRSKQLADDYTDALTEQMDRYAELASKAERTADEKAELERLTKALNAILPDEVKNVIDLGNACETTAKQVKELADSQHAAGLASQMSKLDEYIAKLEKEAEGYERSAKAWKELQESAQRGRSRLAQVAEQPTVQLGGPGGGAAARLAEIDKELADLREKRNKMAAQLAEIMTAPEAEMAEVTTTRKTKTDIPGLTAEQMKAWAQALDALHKMRLELITDQFEKERMAALEGWAALDAQLRALPVTSVEEAQNQFDALLEAEEAYGLKLVDIDKRQGEETLKADQETAQQSVDILLKELDYKRQLYAWDSAAYISALQQTLSQEKLTAEERKLLELELAEARKTANIDAANAIRETNAQVASEGKQMFRDIATAMVDAARGGKDAWDNFGKWLIDYFLHAVLKQVLDGILETKKAAQGMGGGGEGGEFNWQSLLPFLTLFGAQHGAYTRRPTVLMTSEHGQAEITSPEPQMRRIVREEIAAAGGLGSGEVHVHLENIQTYDSKDLIESAYDGPLGRAIEQAVRRGKLILRPA